MKNIKLYNVFFVSIIFIILVVGTLKSSLFSEDINEYENRTAYKYSLPTIKTFFNGEFQNNVELTLADQIPLSTTMKKGYNEFNAKTNYNIMKTLTKDICSEHYVSMVPGLNTFGCDDVLVYYPTSLSNNKEKIDKRINNINAFINNNDKEVYVYYIEKDTDVEFTSNKESNIGEYITSKTKTPYTHIFEINNFKDFKDNFYKTDHHWNYKGSYRGYLELAELLNIKKTLKYGEKKCSTNSFSGSKAAGASTVFKESFCAYDYQLPEHQIYINGNIYSEYSKMTLDGLENVTYGSYYGGDYGEIIFDYNQKKADNILIFGESYDNAIIELIASHFNKTYSIDLRNYERENGLKFDYNNYIKDKKIEKVVFIGNIDFFIMEEFNVEVK